MVAPNDSWRGISAIGKSWACSPRGKRTNETIKPPPIPITNPTRVNAKGLRFMCFIRITCDNKEHGDYYNETAPIGATIITREFDLSNSSDGLEKSRI